MLNERGPDSCERRECDSVGPGCSLPTSLERAGVGDLRWHRGAKLITAQTADFERHRSLSFSIAYRMLGSIADAENVLQEVYLRWQELRETEVRSPRSYLSTVVTRLSINGMRSARARREEYVGWAMDAGKLGRVRTVPQIRFAFGCTGPRPAAYKMFDG
jgi:hypothetical protein